MNARAYYTMVLDNSELLTDGAVDWDAVANNVDHQASEQDEEDAEQQQEEEPSATPSPSPTPSESASPSPSPSTDDASASQQSEVASYDSGAQIRRICWLRLVSWKTSGALKTTTGWCWRTRI